MICCHWLLYFKGRKWLHWKAVFCHCRLRLRLMRIDRSVQKWCLRKLIKLPQFIPNMARQFEPLNSLQLARKLLTISYRHLLVSPFSNHIFPFTSKNQNNTSNLVNWNPPRKASAHLCINSLYWKKNTTTTAIILWVLFFRKSSKATPCCFESMNSQAKR